MEGYPGGPGQEEIRRGVPRHVQQGQQGRIDIGTFLVVTRAVDPHSFFSDPDPAVLFNANSDPKPA